MRPDQASEIRSRARKLLREEYSKLGFHRCAIQLDDKDNEAYHQPMLNAIERALKESIDGE